MSGKRDRTQGLEKPANADELGKPADGGDHKDPHRGLKPERGLGKGEHEARSQPVGGAARRAGIDSSAAGSLLQDGGLQEEQEPAIVVRVQVKVDGQRVKR